MRNMGMQRLTICVLFSLLAVSVCKKPKWKTCDKHAKYEAAVSEIDTDAPVDEKGRIRLKRGSDVTLSYTFKMTEGHAQNVTAVAYFIIEETPSMIKIPNPNACDDSGLVCPLKAPRVYTYKGMFPVSDIWPPIYVILRWELIDESRKDVWCVLVPAVLG